MVDRDGSVSLLSADLERPASLRLSDDERHLFVLDGVTRNVWRFDLDLMWAGELVGTWSTSAV